MCFTVPFIDFDFLLSILSSHYQEFADEPTGYLDTVNGKIIMDIFIMLNEEGRTVVLVRHYNNIADYCSKRIIISDGRVHL